MIQSRWSNHAVGGIECIAVRASMDSDQSIHRYVRIGSFATEAACSAVRPTSASPQKLTSGANEKLVAKGRDATEPFGAGAIDVCIPGKRPNRGQVANDAKANSGLTHCNRESQRVDCLSHLQISACPADRRLDIHIFRHLKCRLKLRSCVTLATRTSGNGPETDAAFH
jgi:hypothetical protein